MKPWILLLFAWIAALAATSANAFMSLSGRSEAGYFSARQHEQKNQPANQQCEIRKDLLAGWLARGIGSTSGYSANRAKNRTDCTNDEWLKLTSYWLTAGRELLLRSVRGISLSTH